MGNKHNFPPLKEGAVIIITGASSGLGKQLSLQLAPKNLKLILAGRDEKRLSEVKEECIARGSPLTETFQGDLVDPNTCRRLITFTQQHHKRIDLLILNAGVNAHFEFASVKDLTVFQQLMKTNFYPNVHITKQALPILKQSKGGIVVISSLSGKFGLPTRSAYCASKFALNGFFESIRTQEQIPILMVYPTSLQTPMRNNSLIQTASNTTNKKQKKREDPKQCASLILKGIETQKQQIYMPWKGFLGVVLQPLFPKLIRWKVAQTARL